MRFTSIQDFYIFTAFSAGLKPEFKAFPVFKVCRAATQSVIQIMRTISKSLLGSTILALSGMSTAAHAQFFDIESATGSGSHARLVPSRAIDGDTRNASRWSGNGNPEELFLDLGTERRLDDAQIAWYLGDRRSFTFEIAARLDTFDSWTTLFSGTSEGDTNDFENYNLTDFDARYVRIRGLSNSDGTAATAIREVTLSGTGGPVEADAPVLSGQSPLPDNAEFYVIQSAAGVGSHARLVPSRAIDGDTRNASRWSGNGSSEELVLDLGTDRDITDVQIAWFLGSSGNRSFIFELDARSSLTNEWTTIFSGESSGATDAFENYNVDDITASELRIRSLSNSDGTTSTAIREVTISGIAEETAPEDPEDPGTTPPGESPPEETPPEEPSETPTGGGGGTTPPDDTPPDDPDAEDPNTEDPATGGRTTPVTEASDFGLDPNLEPWENFDLDDWAYDSPAPRPSDACRAIRSNEDEWDEFRDSPSDPYLFTHTDGGMRFVSPVGGATTNTSCNSGFPRSELREMLRRGNRSISTTGVNGNNWALGYQPGNSDHGGRNGELKATLRVNRVTTTGDGLHPGRTIIGQIHADNDEPARLYYRKLPDADYGCIYLEHEIRDSDDITFNLIGDEQCRNNGPENGIQLDELFSYEITNVDEKIDVVIRRGDQDGTIIAETTVDMDALFSGYDRVDEWMYFKAGAYTQNNTGDPDDTDIITFYRLSNTHDDN